MRPASLQCCAIVKQLAGGLGMRSCCCMVCQPCDPAVLQRCSHLQTIVVSCCV